MPGDAEVGVRIPTCALDHFSRPAHEHARHRAYVAMPPLPRALADPAHRIMHHFMCTHPETHHATTKPVHPRPSHP
jgi:hypothetical protein